VKSTRFFFFYVFQRLGSELDFFFKKTIDSGCKWYFKAVFEDGDESAAKKFDFCEEDLELEF